MSSGSGAWRDVVEQLAPEILVGNQSRRRVALATAEIAVEGGGAAIQQVHQVRAVADDDPGAVAFRAVDFIAFAGHGLAIDGAVCVAGEHGAVDGGFGSDGDVIAPHARQVLV
ncbi:hypothetical protein D3C85_1173140 [compost metagenome]